MLQELAVLTVTYWLWQSTSVSHTDRNSSAPLATKHKPPPWHRETSSGKLSTVKYMLYQAEQHGVSALHDTVLQRLQDTSTVA